MSSCRDQKTSTLAKYLLYSLPAVLLLCLAACNQNKNASVPAPDSAAGAVAATPAATGDTSLPDPCKLLTKAEAEAVLGEPVRDPEPNSLGGNRICDFKTVTVHGGVLPYSVHIAIIREQQQVWDAGKKLYQQSDAKNMHPVAGVGDDAYFLLEDLDIFTRERFVSINVMKSIDKPDHAKSVQDAELAVAQKAIPRMQ
ncbi:MAG TPA: hypothetical protein VK699_12070 [Terriglobales bacterium]|nr:hypothetical protein [Terriglobales bacterium]